ncbi:MAG: hypothetical protein WCJ74_02550 [bacterium]
MKISKRGFIGIIVLVVIAILLLSYLGFDLKKIFTAPAVKNNFSYVWGFISNIWMNYLSVPFTFLWGEAVKPVLELAWKTFMLGIDAIKSANK